MLAIKPLLAPKFMKLQILAPLGVLGAVFTALSLEPQNAPLQTAKVRDVECEVITHPDGSSELILGDDVPGSMSVVKIELGGSLSNQCLMEGQPLDDFMNNQPQKNVIPTDR